MLVLDRKPQNLRENDSVTTEIKQGRRYKTCQGIPLSVSHQDAI